MDIITIIVISIGLSMDAFAVSVTNGFIIKKIQFKHAFRIAFSFGLFQAFMPILGWAAGLTLKEYIESFDHWIAFGLLLFIGLKMILSKESDNSESQNCLHFP
ncbi:MAG: manganese efflux pump, partial [Ignavibacteriales bacterium]|nr:manganese efflux pump [Ignavibacteriales bacterium]